jgi:hypothetical protein
MNDGQFSKEESQALIKAFDVGDVQEYTPNDVAPAMIAGLRIGRECFRAVDQEVTRLGALLDSPANDNDTAMGVLENLERWQKGLQDYAGKLKLGGDAEARMEGIASAVAHIKAFMDPIQL